MASDVSNVQYNADLCLAITRLPSTRSPLNPTDDHHDLHLQYVTQICTTSHSVANTPVHPGPLAHAPLRRHHSCLIDLLRFSLPASLPPPPPSRASASQDHGLGAYHRYIDSPLRWNETYRLKVTLANHFN